MKTTASHYFAVDLGATSGRTLLGTYDGSGIFLMEEINRFPNHLIPARGHFYWDILELYRNILEGLKIVGSRGITLTSIGIDTWGVDFVMLGKDGNIMRQPYAYRDPHTEGAPEALFSRVPSKEVYAATGIQVMNFNTLFQLDTMRRNGDSTLDIADKILFIPDALAYLLTGEAVTEYTIASTGQIVNAASRTLDAGILATVGLTTDKFGRMVYPGDTIGTLNKEVMDYTGLGAVPVVAVGEHDTASAVAAVPTLSRNFAYLSSGTWSLMGVETQSPVINDRTEALNFTNEGGVYGTIRVLKNICGMWLLERCRKEWVDADYADIIRQAGEAEPFRSLIFPDAPCFANPANMVQAIADYCRPTNQPVPDTIGRIARCIFESLALRYRQVLDNLRQLADHPIEVLHVIGGGTRNAMLNQFTANAVGMPVATGPVEATALGNMMVQAISAGQAVSIAEIRSALNKTLGIGTYTPADTEAWNIAYTKFESLTPKN